MIAGRSKFLLLLWALFVIVLPAVSPIPTISRCFQCNHLGITVECDQNHPNCRSCIKRKVEEEMNTNEFHISGPLCCQHGNCAIDPNKFQFMLSRRRRNERKRMIERNQKLLSQDCECCFMNKGSVLCHGGHPVCSECLNFESGEQLAGDRGQVYARQNEEITTALMNCPCIACEQKLPESIVKQGMNPDQYIERTRRMGLLKTLFEERELQQNAEQYRNCKRCGRVGLVCSMLDNRLLCDMIVCNHPSCGARCCAECDEEIFENHRCRDQQKYQQWRKLLLVSTPCPSCRTPIERTDGCVHMQCQNCQCDFCFSCRLIGTHSHCPNGFLWQYRNQDAVLQRQRRPESNREERVIVRQPRRRLDIEVKIVLKCCAVLVPVAIAFAVHSICNQ